MHFLSNSAIALALEKHIKNKISNKVHVAMAGTAASATSSIITYAACMIF